MAMRSACSPSCGLARLSGRVSAQDRRGYWVRPDTRRNYTLAEAVREFYVLPEREADRAIREVLDT